MRPRGTVGDLRRALRDAASRLVREGGLPGVTWTQAVQATGLQLGRTERERARLTMRNMADAAELQFLIVAVGRLDAFRAFRNR